MTDQALLYLFAVPGILALYGAAVWLDAWRRTRLLDAEIAAYRRTKASETVSEPTVASENAVLAQDRGMGSEVRLAILDPADALVLVRSRTSRTRYRRARAESMRMTPFRPRSFPSGLTPEETKP